MRQCERQIVDNLQTLPRSIFLQGEKGSNFIEICEALGNKFNLPIATEVDELEIRKVLYIVNLFETDIKKQNILLKLFEEPDGCVIIYGQNCIETLKTRSYLIKIPQYKDEDLDTTDEKILTYFRTPELVEKAKKIDVEYLESYCYKLIEMIVRAPLFNVLYSVNDYITDDNLELFIEMLPIVALKCKVSKGKYKLIGELKNNINFVTNKKLLLENFIINFWRYEHCE